MRDRALFQIACSDAAAGAAKPSKPCAKQHIEDGGRVLLGLPPEGPMLKGLF